MTSTVMKVEIESESCCVCGGGGDLMTPEEHDVGAPPMQMPLRSMLLHLNNSKVVPDGRLCASCIRRTLESYEFSTALSARAVPPLSEKIRALRRRLHELTQKIDVFIVVGGPGVNAGGTYSEEDIIMVERGALAAAAAADDEDLEKARNAKGDTVYQCSVCPLSFQRVSEYRSHVSCHGADALHSCWTCGAQFTTRVAAREHNQQHHQHLDTHHLTCHLCHTTYQSVGELRRHEAGCEARCPACGLHCGSRAALSAHVTSHHGPAVTSHAGGVHVCAWCFATCDTAAALAAHTLRHRQAKQFVCGYDGCILRFGTRSYLMSHIRKCHVSEELPDQDRQAATGAGAGAAAATAAGDVPCQHCTRTFASAAAMKRHSRVHRNITQAQAQAQAHAQDDMDVQQGEEGEGEAAGLALGVDGAEGEVEYLEVETLEDLDYQDLKPPLHL